MKKYTEILNEIAKAKKAIKDTAKTEKELNRIAFREACKDGATEEEKTAMLEAYRTAEARYIKECEHNDSLKLKIEILKENAAQALFNENIGTICDTWNKYEGKPHGEKTAAKIREEIKNKTGLTVYIGNRYDDAHIQIYFHYTDKICAPFNSLEFVPIWDGSSKKPALIDNKIVKLNPEGLRVYYCGAYVEDVNAHLKALKKAHQKAKAAEKALEDAISEYNALTRGTIQRASKHEGVKNWMI